MAKNTNYRQCRLSKKTQNGEMIQTSWIPDQFAKLGKVIKIRQSDVWSNGWIVKQVSETCLPESNLPNFHKEIKGHRKTTGDSLPKSQ